MKYYGTKNGQDYGFYLVPFEGAVEVEDAVWEELIAQCAGGKIIQPNTENFPIAVERIESEEELAGSARVRRNSLLVQSDWTQLQDADLTENERQQWQTYRQALRDIPQQPGFPKQIAWPIL